LAIVCSVTILLLYVNFLRERTLYGDVGNYIRAAFNLKNGMPFHGRYIYPPLLATLCQPLLLLGKQGLTTILWLANILALIAFFWLLKAVLQRYGFGQRLSPLLVFLFMCVNVPILRTLGYIQINLHVINLILLAMLLFPYQRILSALALAMAVHLKISPIILALPFFLKRDKKWIISFLAGLAGLSGLTIIFFGWTPFMNFLHNASNIYSANDISFRENSIDSLIRSTAFLLGAHPSLLILIIKVPIMVLLIVTAIYNTKHATFFAHKEAGQNILNSIPAFLILMVIASPLVWEHHPVFLAIPFILIIKKLNTPNSWMWFGLAYLLEFLMPTFDFYPWSFGRLLSPLILMLLIFQVNRQNDSNMFLFIRNRLDSLSLKGSCRADTLTDSDKQHL
jgi:hypothetical protein